MNRHAVCSRFSFAEVMMATITICFTAVLAAYSVLGAASERENGFVRMKRGETFTMECKTKDNEKDSLSIYARLPRKEAVIFCDQHTNDTNFGQGYKERVNISGVLHKLTMRLGDLQPNDSGLYKGLYSKFDRHKNEEDKEEGCAILLFVNDVDKPQVTEKSYFMSEPLVLVFALTVCTMIVVCFLVICVFAPKVKARCLNHADNAAREYNPVYEDMHRLQNK